MDSSTSPSDSRFPAYAAILLLTAIVAWLGCIFYTLELNPEICFYRQGAAIKDRWAEKMTREHGAKVLIYGGSSCAFSIDGERLLNRFNLPTVNYGREAGLGSAILTESVLGHVNPGDTLIVALEPALLTQPLDLPANGIQFSFAAHHPEWAIHPAISSASVINWFQALAALRPGGLHVFTLLGKIISGKPLFRYQASDFNPSGWQQTDVRLEITGPPGHGVRLSDDACVLLRNLRTWCNEHNVRVAYSLPWAYTPAAKQTSFQKDNLAFLLQINEFMPVLRDDLLGADPHIEHYADTAWHLNKAAADLRTDELGEQIKNWEIWTIEELHHRESRL